MAPVLHCPECGTKHPLDGVGGVGVPVHGCGRTLKVPAAGSGSAAHASGAGRAPRRRAVDPRSPVAAAVGAAGDRLDAVVPTHAAAARAGNEAAPRRGRAAPPLDPVRRGGSGSCCGSSRCRSAS